jgi:tetratricopeptide (TPR) repeat protein
VYRPYPGAGFVLDAQYVVERNPLIKSPDLYGQIFTSGFFEPYKSSPSINFNYYRPLVTASYVPDYWIWGGEAAGYRLTNVLIHFLNCLLVYFLVLLLLEESRVAVLCAFFFAVLPVHEWVVNYVVGRGDLLQCFFSLLALIALVRYLRKGGVGWMVAGKLAFIAALLCREAAVLFPVYAGMVIWFQSRKMKRVLRLLMPFIGISLLYYLGRQLLFPVMAREVSGFSPAVLGEGIARSFEYAVRFWVPWPLLHKVPYLADSVVVQISFVFIVFAAGAAVIAGRKEKKPKEGLFLAAGWMLAGAAPFFLAGPLIKRLGPYLSEHFLYFPSIGFVIFLSLVLVSLRSPAARKLSTVALAAYYVFIVTFSGSFWKNEEMLLRRVRETEKGRPTVAVRQLLMKYDDDIERVLELGQATGVPAVQSRWLHRAGHLYRTRGEEAKAGEYFDKALEANPANLDALNERAVLYLETGRWEEGIALLRRSAALDATYPETYRLLGEAFYRRGEFVQAIAFFRAARDYAPDSGTVVLHLAMASFFTGDAAEYARHMESAFKIHPDVFEVLTFVARELFRYGYFTEVIYLLEKNKGFVASSAPLSALLEQAYRKSPAKTDP